MPKSRPNPDSRTAPHIETQYKATIRLPYGIDWRTAETIETFVRRHLAPELEVSAIGSEIEVTGKTVALVRNQCSTTGSLIDRLELSASTDGARVYAVISGPDDFGSWVTFSGSSEVGVRGLKATLEAVPKNGFQSAMSSPEDVVRLAGDDRLNNDPFSASEAEDIRLSLKRIQDYILASRDLGADEVAALNKRVDYLRQAVERLGRKDWILLAIGGVLELTLELGLNPDQARQLLRWLFDGVRALVP